VRIIRQYVAENGAFQEVLPDTVVDRQMTLRFGSRTIGLRWFGRGNTRGDLVIWLPNEKVLASGDLVVAPIPFGFNSYPTEWIAVLDSVVALQPQVLVPGHGPVMRDLSYVRTVRRMLSTARERTLAEMAKGTSVDSVLQVVRLDDLRSEVAGDEKWMRTMFGMFFRRPVITRLYEEAKNGSLK
jgi:glyoxylase-like metal-dependent hydrolase (beta-lactamase superfamily II)